MSDSGDGCHGSGADSGGAGDAAAAIPRQPNAEPVRILPEINGAPVIEESHVFVVKPNASNRKVDQ